MRVSFICPFILLISFFFLENISAQEKELYLLVDAMCVCITSDTAAEDGPDSQEVEDCFEGVMGEEMDKIDEMFADSSKTTEENEKYFQSDILPLMMSKLAGTCPQVITYFMQAAQQSANEQADSLKSNVELGINYSEAGKYNAAIEEFDKALSIEESKELYNYRGVAKVRKID